MRGPAHWAWRGLTVLLAPWVALAMALHPRTRETWSQRWGLRLPQVPPGGVLIHAASIGEGQIAASLFEDLRKRLPGIPLIRSAWTNTGLKTAQGQHAVLPLPVDLWAIVGPWLDQVRPGVLVLVETELWPNLLAACADREIPVIVVGTRNSNGFRRLSNTPMMSLIRSCVATWLPAEDLPWAAGLGSLKGSPKTPLALDLARPILVGASTRAGDEAALLAAWEALDRPGTLVLAPRHPERFLAVSRLLPVNTPRRSQGQTGPLIFWDTLGELDRLMPLADAVFIGGTFDQAIGGHAPHAAIQGGAPIIHGPYTGSNSNAFDPNRCTLAIGASSLSDSLTKALSLGRVAPSQSKSAALELTLRTIHRGQSGPGLGHWTACGPRSPKAGSRPAKSRPFPASASAA